MAIVGTFQLSAIQKKEGFFFFFANWGYFRDRINVSF